MSEVDDRPKIIETTAAPTSKVTTLEVTKPQVQILKPFVLYGETYTDDKLPPNFVIDHSQNYTTASVFTIIDPKCSETLVIIKTARGNFKRRADMRNQLKKLRLGLEKYYLTCMLLILLRQTTW